MSIALATVACKPLDTGGDPVDGPTPSRWVPPAQVSWQWVLAEPFDVTNAAHLASDRVTYDGKSSAAPTVFDIDGFTNTAATVDWLHTRGAFVICYVETGGWEPYRPDADLYPTEILGNPVDGYPDERYVDIRAEAVFARVSARVRMCADKGFDAVEPDLDDSYAEDTGFALTRDDSIEFNRRVADLAHSLGLSIALKNGDEPEFAAAMEPLVDFAVVEQCFEFDGCAAFAPFVEHGKAVLEVEYNLDPSEFCADAIELGFSAVLHDPELSGGGTPCQ